MATSPTSVDPAVPTPSSPRYPRLQIGGLITLASALANCTTMVCQEKFDAGAALDLIDRERCVAVMAQLSFSQALREYPSVPGRDLTCLAMLTAPAAARPYGTLGMTQSCGPHLGQPIPTTGRGPRASPREPRCGAAHFDHKVIDDGEVIVGDGEGEACIRGYATLAGLSKRQGHEVIDDNGYYHTGDRVRSEDGLFFYTGRVTELIKTHRADVAPPEVEAVLESFPEVVPAFLVGIPDAQGWPGRRGWWLTAAGELDASDSRAKARRELSAHKVPTFIPWMADGEVPWLATGKPDRRAMKQLLVKATR